MIAQIFVVLALACATFAATQEDIEFIARLEAGEADFTCLVDCVNAFLVGFSFIFIFIFFASSDDP